MHFAVVVALELQRILLRVEAGVSLVTVDCLKIVLLCNVV